MNDKLMMFDSIKSEDIPIVVLSTECLTFNKSKKTEIKVEFLKKSLEFSFNNEQERDEWFEVMQLTTTFTEEKTNKIVFFFFILFFFFLIFIFLFF